MGAKRQIGGGILAAASLGAALLLDRTFTTLTDGQLWVGWALLAGGVAIGTALMFWQPRAPAGPPTVGRDTPLHEAVCYIAGGRWGQRWGEEEGGGDLDSYGPAWKRLRQAAADGVITIWGRRTMYAAYAPVPAAYWVDHQPEWFSMWEADATTEKTDSRASDDNYLGLMVSRREVERAWPARGRR